MRAKTKIELLQKRVAELEAEREDWLTQFVAKAAWEHERSKKRAWFQRWQREFLMSHQLRSTLELIEAAVKDVTVSMEDSLRRIEELIGLERVNMTTEQDLCEKCDGTGVVAYGMSELETVECSDCGGSGYDIKL